MYTIFLQKSTDRLCLKEGQLLHYSDDETVKRYPICATELIHVYGNAQITTQAVKECLKEGVRINYFNKYGCYLGRLEPGYPKNVRRRLSQYRMFFDKERRLSAAKSLVEAKIQGELIELRRLQEQGYRFPLKEFRTKLKYCRQKVKDCRSIGELMGIEGLSAKEYYNIFQYVLPAGMEWRGRSYHPAKDNFNVLLSCIYGMAAQVLREEIEKRSLDTACSFLHEPDYGRGGLSYDFLELFRALLCDNIAIRLLRRERSIQEFIRAKTSCRYVPEDIRYIAERRFRKELVCCRGVQKKTPCEQISEVVSIFIGSLDGRNDLDFSQILPER